MFVLLDTVNQILADLSLVEVDAGHLDQREPKAVIRELDKQFSYNFALGWDFNTYETEYTPDGAGNIIIPDTALRWKAIPTTTRYQLGAGRKLFDRDNETFVYDSDFSLKIKTVETISRDECPQWFLDLVYASTAWALRSKLGGMVEATNEYLQEQLVRYRAVAVQANIEATTTNSVKNDRLIRGLRVCV